MSRMKSALRACLMASLAASMAAPSAMAAQELDKREKQRIMQQAEEATASGRRLLQKGETKDARQRFLEAETLYRRILESEPTHKGAAIGASNIYYLTRRYEDGINVIRPLYEAKPDDLDLAHQLGIHLYKNGDRDEAIRLLERVAQHEERFDAMWLLSTHFYREAEWERGLNHMERYVKTRPEDTKALGLLGTYYLKMRRFDECVSTLDKFLQEYPDNTAAQINRANALFRSDRLDEAGDAYEALLARFPKRARLLYNLAAVRIKQNRCEDAVKLLDDFLATQKKNATALYFKADCQFKLGRLAEARSTFEEAGASAAKNPWVYYGLSQIAYTEGKMDEALRYALKAADLDDDWEIATWVGTLLRRAGKPGEALGWHDKAVEQKPDEPRIHVERGRDLWALKRVDDCVAAFDQAIKLDDSNKDARVGWVTAKTAKAVDMRKAGNTDGARTHLKDALARIPEYDIARVNLALIELTSNNVDAAEKAVSGDLKDADNPNLAAVRAMVHLLRGRDAQAKQSLDAALKGKTSLNAVAFTAQAHLAAKRGEWQTAAQAFEKANEADPAETTKRAATHAWLMTGLERLGQGEGGGALNALRRAAGDKNLLNARDRTSLDYGLAAAGVLTKPDEAAAKQMEAVLNGRGLAGAGFANLRDQGWAYVAYARLKGGNAKGTLAALKKVRNQRAVGAVYDELENAANDILAEKAFAAKNYKEAAKLWKKIAATSKDGAIKHNLTAAEFASGKTGNLKTWSDQAASASPPESLYNLAVAADRKGQYKQAYELYKRYASKAQGKAAQRAKARAEAKERVFGFGGGGVN